MKKERIRRRPLPLEALYDTLHDQVHKVLGLARVAHAIKISKKLGDKK